MPSAVGFPVPEVIISAFSFTIKIIDNRSLLKESIEKQYIRLPNHFRYSVCNYFTR